MIQSALPLGPRILCLMFNKFKDHLSRDERKPVFGFQTMSDTNRAVQAQRMARSLKFRISEEEKLYYPSSENKGADQLRIYCEADLCLCFCIGKNPVSSCRGSFHPLQNTLTCLVGIPIYCPVEVHILMLS